MHKKEFMAFVSMMAVAWYFSIIIAFSAGREAYSNDKTYLETIRFYQIATSRYRNLYKAEKGMYEGACQKYWEQYMINLKQGLIK